MSRYLSQQLVPDLQVTWRGGNTVSLCYFFPVQKLVKRLPLTYQTYPTPNLGSTSPHCIIRMPSACELSPWLTESTSTAGNPSPTFWLYHVHSTQHWRHLLLFLFLPGVVLLLCLCHNHLYTLCPGFFRKPSFNIFQPMM